MPRETFRKVIVTEDLLKQVNPENIKLRDKFLKEKSTRSSNLTIKGYFSDLNIFCTWCLLYNNNIHFTDMRKIQFSEFFSYCVDELKWNSARYGRMKSTLSSFSNFISKFYDEDFPRFKPIVLQSVELMPKSLVREKTVLSEIQMNDLFNILKENNETQIICWLALAIASGSRFSELLRFTTDIIDENLTAFDGLFLETTKQIKCKGRTRSGKLLTKYIVKDLFWDKYQDWLIERKKIMDKKGKDHNSIFIKMNGDPAEESTARGWVSKIEEYGKINFYPHLCRHYYCTFLSRINIPPELIKELVGWSDLSMIPTYNDLEAKDREWQELGKLKEHLENNK
jgi:site-specific recombinase XerD